MRSYSDIARKRETEIQELKERIKKLEAVAQAAEKARYELIRPLRHGETIFECAYRAKEILSAALHGGE